MLIISPNLRDANNPIAKDRKRKKSRKLTPHVFTGIDGTKQIKDFRGSWKSACERAKIGIGFSMTSEERLSEIWLGPVFPKVWP